MENKTIIFEMPVFYLDKFGDDIDDIVIVEAESPDRFCYYYSSDFRKCPINLGALANGQIKNELTKRFAI